MAVARICLQRKNKTIHSGPAFKKMLCQEHFFCPSLGLSIGDVLLHLPCCANKGLLGTEKKGAALST